MPTAARPMLQPFEQQLPPGVEADDVKCYAPRRPARRTNLPPKGRLLAICPAGHGLTALNSQEQTDGSLTCLLCQKNN